MPVEPDFGVEELGSEQHRAAGHRPAVPDQQQDIQRGAVLQELQEPDQDVSGW